MRNPVVVTAIFFSGLAVAQGLPKFGTAKFGEAVFGQASTGADALPVPFMPLWANITLAVALWVVAYLMRAKEADMNRTYASAVLLLIMTESAYGLTYQEPPDLTSNLAIPDQLGALSVGLNTISGSVSGTATNGMADPASDSADSFEFTIPAGLVADYFKLDITSFTATGNDYGRARDFTNGTKSEYFYSDAAYTNLIIDATGYLQPGAHDFQVRSGFQPGGNAAVSFNWLVTISVGSPQVITFANPGGQTVGVNTTVTATSDSGLTVTFTSATTAVCTITSGGALTLVSPGNCTINADQAGDATRAAAQRVAQTFAVAAAPVSPSVPVPTLPAILLMAMSGLLALFGVSGVRASK